MLVVLSTQEHNNITTYIVHNDFLVDLAEHSSLVQYGGHSTAAGIITITIL